MALTEKLKAIADAIRGKTGKAEEMTLDQMAVEIAGIETGGAGYTEQDFINAMAINNFPSGDITIYGTQIGRSVFSARVNIAKVVAPDATSIGNSAFSGCTELHSISFPQVSTGVGSAERAFYGCAKLVNVDVPLFTSIPIYMFDGCKALEKVVFPKAVSTAVYAMQNCSNLKTVDMLGGNQIANATFTNDTAFKTLILRSTALTTLGNTNAFNGTPFAKGGTGGTVYVPAALIESYQTATNWSTLYAAGTCNFVAIEGSEYE